MQGYLTCEKAEKGSRGQASEYEQAGALIEGFTSEAVLADKGYDFEAFVGAIQSMGSQAVIPSKKNRLHPHTLDRHLYKARNLLERFFLKLKQFRRIATRYERLARNYQELSGDVEPCICRHLACLIENVL